MPDFFCKFPTGTYTSRPDPDAPKTDPKNRTERGMRQFEVVHDKRTTASFFKSVENLFRQLFCCRGDSRMERTQSSEKLVDSSLGRGKTSETTKKRGKHFKTLEARDPVAENARVKTMTGGTSTGLTWCPGDPLITQQDDAPGLTVTAEIRLGGQNIPTNRDGPNLISTKEKFNEVFDDGQGPGDTLEEKFKMVFDPKDPKNPDDSN
jgi:hypothetical protein